MSLLVGVPVILPPDPAVVASWNYDHHHQVLVINGSARDWEEPSAPFSVFPYEGDNRGVAASWNLIFEHARVCEYDYVALMSQGVRLDGGTARLADLVCQHADWRGLLTDFAWRVIVLSVELWEKVGRFDERFLAYYEDSDYVRRMFLAGVHAPGNMMPKVLRDQLDGVHTEAATLQSGMIDSAQYGRSGMLFRAKWGADPFNEIWDRPEDPRSLNPTNNWNHHDRET